MLKNIKYKNLLRQTFVYQTLYIQLDKTEQTRVLEKSNIIYNWS